MPAYEGAVGQPPPTPGIANWVFNSLFNRQTPVSKYGQGRTNIDANHYDYDHRRDPASHSRSHYDRDRPRTKTQRDFSTDRARRWMFDVDDEQTTRLRDFNRERELLNEDFTENSDTFHRRTRSMGNLNNGGERISLNHPGKFPSPYVRSKTNQGFNLSSSPPQSKLLSSTSKNMKLASSNAQRNRNIVIDSSPFVIPDRTKTTTERNQSFSLRPDDDEREILRVIDSNSNDLEIIARDLNSLKFHSDHTSNADYLKLQQKYKEVRAELITELKKSQKLYDTYYKFLNKYKKLKDQVKLNDVSDDKVLLKKIKYLEERISSQEDVYKEEKFQLTRKISTLESELSHQDRSYKEELQKKEKRIRDLESQLLQNENFNNFKSPSSFSPLNLNQKNPNDSFSPSKSNDTLELINQKYPDRVIESDEFSRPLKI